MKKTIFDTFQISFSPINYASASLQSKNGFHGWRNSNLSSMFFPMTGKLWVSCSTSIIWHRRPWNENTRCLQEDANHTKHNCDDVKPEKKPVEYFCSQFPFVFDRITFSTFYKLFCHQNKTTVFSIKRN